MALARGGAGGDRGGPDPALGSVRSMDEVDIQEQLGEGAFGAVYRAVHTSSGRQVALKLIHTRKMRARAAKVAVEGFKNEVETLQSFPHENIVSLFAAGGPDEEGRLWMLMELCDGGSLSRLVNSDSTNPNERVLLSEAQIKFVALSLTRALAFLHQRGIFHRDVKSLNVLLTGDGRVKLTDFDVAHGGAAVPDAPADGPPSPPDSPISRPIGSPLWMAPEVVTHHPPTAASDVWSLGATLFELAEGDPPWYHTNIMRAMVEISRSPPPRLSDPSLWSSQMADFVHRCLDKDPKRRPSSEELLRHPWIASASGLPSSPLAPLLKGKALNNWQARLRVQRKILSSAERQQVESRRRRMHAATHSTHGIVKARSIGSPRGFAAPEQERAQQEEQAIRKRADSGDVGSSVSASSVLVRASNRHPDAELSLSGLDDGEADFDDGDGKAESHADDPSHILTSKMRETLRNLNRQDAGEPLRITVHVHLAADSSASEHRRLQLEISRQATVREVVDSCLRQLDTAAKSAHGVQLRMVESEGNGEPDMDVPPLQGDAVFASFGVSHVALTLGDGASAASTEGDEEASRHDSRGQSVTVRLDAEDALLRRMTPTLAAVAFCVELLQMISLPFTLRLPWSHSLLVWRTFRILTAVLHFHIIGTFGVRFWIVCFAVGCFLLAFYPLRVEHPLRSRKRSSNSEDQLWFAPADATLQYILVQQIEDKTFMRERAEYARTKRERRQNDERMDESHSNSDYDEDGEKDQQQHGTVHAGGRRPSERAADAHASCLTSRGFFRAVVIFCWLMAVPLFLPVLRTLLDSFKCIDTDGSDDASALATDESLRCWSDGDGQQVAMTVIAALVILPFLALAVRLLGVGGWVTNTYERPALVHRRLTALQREQRSRIGREQQQVKRWDSLPSPHDWMLSTSDFPSPRDSAADPLAQGSTLVSASATVSYRFCDWSADRIELREDHWFSRSLHAPAWSRFYALVRCLLCAITVFLEDHPLAALCCALPLAIFLAVTSWRWPCYFDFRLCAVDFGGAVAVLWSVTFNLVISAPNDSWVSDDASSKIEDALSIVFLVGLLGIFLISILAMILLHPQSPWYRRCLAPCACFCERCCRRDEYEGVGEAAPEGGADGNPESVRMDQQQQQSPAYNYQELGV